MGRLTNLYISSETIDNTSSQFWKTWEFHARKVIQQLTFDFPSEMTDLQGLFVGHLRKLDIKQDVELGENLVVTTRDTKI